MGTAPSSMDREGGEEEGLARPVSCARPPASAPPSGYSERERPMAVDRAVEEGYVRYVTDAKL